MASKKPAKVSSHEKKVNTVIGTAFYYFGNTNKPFTCASCGRVFVKGIAYEKDSKSACTRKCLEQLLSL